MPDKRGSEVAHGYSQFCSGRATCCVMRGDGSILLQVEADVTKLFARATCASIV